MDLVLKQKDIISAFKEKEIKVLIHQCNCTTSDQRGLAKSLVKEFPDLKGYIANRQDMYAMFNVAEVREGMFIANMFAQYFSGPPYSDPFYDQNGKKLIDNMQTRHIALRKCLKDFYSKLKPGVKVGMPLIASGLASSKKLKGNMTDLEYFERYVYPDIADIIGLKESTVIYYK